MMRMDVDVDDVVMMTLVMVVLMTADDVDDC